MGTAKTYTLIGPDGAPYESATPGTLGGHRRGKLYGRLDCPDALYRPWAALMQTVTPTVPAWPPSHARKSVSGTVSNTSAAAPRTPALVAEGAGHDP
jgi:hypothetical protein